MNPNHPQYPACILVFDQYSCGMIIAYQKLSAKALRGVIEEFVTRDGTEQTDVETKIAQVRRQLEQGKAVILYDPQKQTCHILPADEGAPRKA